MPSLNVRVYAQYAASPGTGLDLLMDCASLVFSQEKQLLFMAQSVCLFVCYFVPLLLSVKTRPLRMPPGYQADLVIQLVWVDGEPPQQITSLAVNSAYGL